MKMQWLCVVTGWILFAEGGVICFTAFHAWPLWGASYLLAVVFWFAMPALIRRAQP